MFGKTTEADYPAVHIFNGSSSSAKFIKERTQSGLCEHTEYIDLLPVMVQKKQLLAMSCLSCQKIRLYNMKTREITTAFNDPSYYPGQMCEGDGDQIYVVHPQVMSGFPILQLSCSQPQFSLQKTIHSRMKGCYYAICYIPSHRLIVISNHTPGIVRAVSCDTDQIDWELQGEVQGVQCTPHEMVYSPGHQALLVVDGTNHRVLVVNPGDGSVRQVVQLSAEMGSVAELCLHNQQLVVHHLQGRKVSVSYFSFH